MSQLLFQKNKCTFFLFIAILFSQFSYSQLSDFTLQVTPTNETCAGNGSLSFAVSGTTASATMLYSVYLLPNITTPIATLSGTTFGGLVAGNYSVVATQTLGSNSGFQQQTVTITSQITPLTYQLVGGNPICGNNGTITVNVTTGVAVSYEIFAGTAIVPLQNSNVFTGLAAGTYQIRVFNACGEGVVQSFILTPVTAGLSISNGIPNPPLTCGSVLASHVLFHNSATAFAYPITIVCTIFPPTGPTIVLTQIITSGDANNVTYSQDIPLFPNQSYTYNLTATDGCGNTYIRNNNVVNSNIIPVAISTPTSCNLSQIFIRVVQTVVMTSAPAAYSVTLPFDFTPGIALGSVFIPNVPPGTYTFTVTDVCGNTHILNVTVQPPPVQNPSFLIREGCDEQTGSVNIKSENGNMVSMIIVEAPSTYPNSLPHNVSFNIPNNGSNFIMNSLPIGNYKFHFADACGNEFDVPITLQGFHMVTNNFSVTENCSSFNLTLNHTNNSPFNNTFWLQKYNSATNQWTHPVTGNPYVVGTEFTSSNAFSLTNNSTNINLALSGNFRIVMNFKVFGNGTFIDVNCSKVLGEFEFTSGPKINNVYSFSCGNNTSDVVVEASGLGPLLYRITTKNGNTFDVDNVNSSIFLGLEPAIYNFQVEDVCGNILNRVFDVSTPYVFSVTPTNLCQGQVGSLSVPNFSFLTYQWWEGNNTTTILSTTSVLAFPNFNSATDNGIYHVSISNPGNVNSCVNFTLEHEISTTSNNPNAGTGTTDSYCGNQGIIDLFTHLTGTFDTNGVWIETSSGGVLVNGIWNSTTVNPGVYQFKYRVNGSCGIFDESFVTITINHIPETPVAFLEQVVCESQSLTLLASTIDNANYEWTGPNGFTSNEQYPIISPLSTLNNGTYTVKATENGCESGTSSVEVEVGSLPQFTLESGCVENAYTLTATPINNSFGTSPVTFSWTGPNNFTSTGNPINITGETKGDYVLTVTNASGCSFTATIPVLNTLCVIPQGVSVNDDGDNDTFNLTGFDVTNLKIFNRYGMIVFEQDNYIDQWHGQDYNNNELPGATYYYLIRLLTGEAKSGWVYLIRK